MKFKAQDKQNQLIENITVHHLSIGELLLIDFSLITAISFTNLGFHSVGCRYPLNCSKLKPNSS